MAWPEFYINTVFPGQANGKYSGRDYVSEGADAFDLVAVARCDRTCKDIFQAPIEEDGKLCLERLRNAGKHRQVPRRVDDCQPRAFRIGLTRSL